MCFPYLQLSEVQVYHIFSRLQGIKKIFLNFGSKCECLYISFKEQDKVHQGMIRRKQSDRYLPCEEGEPHYGR